MKRVRYESHSQEHEVDLNGFQEYRTVFVESIGYMCPKFRVVVRALLYIAKMF